MMEQIIKNIKNTDWMHSKWRPMMAITYMSICIFDFIVGPIFFNIMQLVDASQPIMQWIPLTLQGGGLFHLAMGAVLGISAHGRTLEKLNEVVPTEIK